MSSQLTESIIARQSPEAQEIIRALLAENLALRTQIAGLRAELDELRRQVKGKTPQNSSLPPSTQHPHAKPQPQKPKSKKKRGGQPGHQKHERPLVPTSGGPPPPQRRVTESRRHRLSCPGCGESTCADLPPGVPRGQSGPRLVALTALLMAYYRPNKRRNAEFLTALLGQPCCPALTVKMQRQATAALRGAYDELVAQLPTQDQLSGDETATKEQNRKAWLWTFVARTFTVFALRASREATAGVELLTAGFNGVGTCDRAGV